MKKRWHGLVVAGALLLLASSAWAGNGNGNGNGGGPAACDEAAVAAAQASVDASCPCEGKTDDTGAVVPWKNHGQYVRCVAKATKAAVKDSDGAVTRRCLRSSVRCAARSTCGKRDGFVNCTTTTGAETSCSFRPSADLCTASGGTPGTGSCCAPVPVGSPSGAFVDGGTVF
jgi:hypothetical protein